MTYLAKVIAGGKLVIPAALRRELGIVDGETVQIDRATDGSLSVRTHKMAVERLQADMRARLKTPFTVDDFIAERRRAADAE